MVDHDEGFETCLVVKAVVRKACTERVGRLPLDLEEHSVAVGLL